MRSESVKGFITRIGTRIIKGVCRFPYFHSTPIKFFLLRKCSQSHAYRNLGFQICIGEMSEELAILTAPIFFSASFCVYQSKRVDFHMKSGEHAFFVGVIPPSMHDFCYFLLLCLLQYSTCLLLSQEEFCPIWLCLFLVFNIPRTQLMLGVGHQSASHYSAPSTLFFILPGPLAKSPSTPAIDCPPHPFEPSP